MFPRLYRLTRFYERVQLPDIDREPHEISHAGRVVERYPPSPSWVIRLPLWAGLRRLGTYAPSTARRKRKAGLPDTQIVLYETGALYRSIRVLNMKKYYLITVKRDKLQYIIRRFPVEAWLRVDASAIRRKVAAAVLAALLGCAPLKRTQQSVTIAHEQVVAHETLRVTTTLSDTIHLRNERLIVSYDTLRQVLRIEQVRPVTVRRDSVVIERIRPITEPAEGFSAGWWQKWGKGAVVLGFVLSLLLFVGYLWLRALRIK